MKYRNLSISLPEAMAETVDMAAKREHRTRSELIREALRLYLSGVPSEEPTAAEAAAMARGAEEIRRGESVKEERGCGVGIPRGSTRSLAAGGVQRDPAGRVGLSTSPVSAGEEPSAP